MILPPLNTNEIKGLPPDKFRAVLTQLVDIQSQDRRENQIMYYRPNSEGQRRVHLSKAHTMAVSGGNRSGKTESCLAELVSLGTGVFPTGDAEIVDAFHDKFRGPCRIRVVVESLTTTLYPIILPKLQYWKWEGIDRPGGKRGHWGWIPKLCLKDGSWERAWHEKTRTLTTLCRDPEDFDRVLGETTWQFMSFDQDWSDFASGSIHFVLHDEPPPWSIWRENQFRVLDVNGRNMVAMTWPEDPSIPVDWLYDVYEKGRDGPNKDPDIDWFELSTLENRMLDQEAVQQKWNSESITGRQVKLLGKPIRFANRIHPLFTDSDAFWSFPAGREVYPERGKDGWVCPETGSPVHPFNHVLDFELQASWPAVFVIDPHPRKPHMWLWVVVAPDDDLWVIAEGELEGDCVDVREAVERTETEMSIRAAVRLIDPNMGRSPASTKREVTWQDEFDAAGLTCDLADDSSVGRQRLNEYLKPNEHTKRPRIHVHSRCVNTIWQLKRYVWADYRKSLDKDLKQFPRDKNDDYPTMLKYVMNFEPRFDFLHYGAPVITRPGRRGY